ncbi:Acidic fibroblast growth factor intracellular binding protein, partial [Operophtera brumata]
MYTEVDVFVSNFTLIDPEIYQLWIEGCSYNFIINIASTQAIMASWTYCCTGPEYYDTEMDREFLLELRELRILLDKEKKHKQLYTRALVGLACNLHRGRELRSLFIDLLERCIEPLRLGSWPKTDLAQFLCAYEQCALQMDVL